MPAARTYPGVYIEEVASGVRTIIGVATSITAFIGRTRRGPSDRPVRVQSFADFERAFGGLWEHSTLSYAVQQFFANGGSDALIVRVHNTAQAATLVLATLSLTAANEGDWGEQLRVRIDHDTRPLRTGEPASSLFNLTVGDMATRETERFLKLSTQPDHVILGSGLAITHPAGSRRAPRPTPCRCDNVAVISPARKSIGDQTQGGVEWFVPYGSNSVARSTT